MLKKIIPVALALSTVIFTSVFAVPSAQASTE
ncbi:5'-nucleotidase, partial [Bacillus anthracis]